MRSAPFICALLLLSSEALAGQATVTGTGPIIDMHLHARRETSQEIWKEAVLTLQAQGVVLTMLSFHDSALIGVHENPRERFWLGPGFPCYDARYPAGGSCFEAGGGWPDLGWLRSQYASGRLRMMGELFYVYYGMAPTDERLAPYWALAEELDIPVGVHIGRGPPPSARAPGCCPEFNDDYGNPALLEPILQRHPGLRIWLMHAGGRDFFEETVVLMNAHPNVYADMSIVNSIAPEAAHAARVRDFVDAGLSDRLMFGSDNMPIDPIVERIEGIGFLTAEQRAGIYCRNAARFLRLDPEICARR